MCLAVVIDPVTAETVVAIGESEHCPSGKLFGVQVPVVRGRVRGFWKKIFRAGIARTAL
jgi:hypothetical protein